MNFDTLNVKGIMRTKLQFGIGKKNTTVCDDLKRNKAERSELRKM